MEEERRQFLRISILADVSYKKRDLPLVSDQATVSKNIGQGGICFIAYDELKISDILDLTISLPGEPQIKTIGRVVWTRGFSIGDATQKKYDVGFEFMQISKKDSELINKYVFSKLPLGK